MRHPSYFIPFSKRSTCRSRSLVGSSKIKTFGRSTSTDARCSLITRERIRESIE